MLRHRRTRNGPAQATSSLAVHEAGKGTFSSSHLVGDKLAQQTAGFMTPAHPKTTIGKFSPTGSTTESSPDRLGFAFSGNKNKTLQGNFEESVRAHAMDTTPNDPSRRTKSSLSMYESMPQYTNDEVLEREAAQQKEFQTLRTEMQKTAGQLKSLHEERAAAVFRMERDRAELSEKLKCLEKEREELIQSKARQAEKIASLIQQLAQQKDAAGKLAAELTSTRSEHEKEQRKMVSKVALLDNQVGKVRSELEGSNRLLSEARAERDRLAEERKNCLHDLSGARSSTTYQKEELARKDATLSELETRLEQSRKEQAESLQRLQQQYETVSALNHPRVESRSPSRCRQGHHS